MTTFYPHGQCPACGQGLLPEEQCQNQDCSRSTEPMTGWDEPDDLNGGMVMSKENPGRAFLKALERYMRLDVGTDTEATWARADLLVAMDQIDWDLVGFALQSQAQGEDLFTAHPNNDVLLKYTPGESRNPDQQELAF